MSYSIIIPSRNIDNLRQCVAAIRASGDQSRIIVVWDGDKWPIDLGGESWIAGIKPFCFARNVNIGIRAAGYDDVVLMNDDALLIQGKLSGLVRSGYGIISACVKAARVHPVHDVTKRAGFIAAVPFVCVFIRREVIDTIGLLDEQFTPGGYEDDDYCRRARDTDYEIGVGPTVVVDHETLPHTFRPAGQKDLYDPEGRLKYARKWIGK